MKKLLIILLALVMVLGVVACTDKKSAESDGKGDDKKTEEKDKKDAESTEDSESTEKTAEDEGNGVGFEFEYKSLKLKVDSIEDHEYDPENDSYDAPEGKYVIVTCSILEGEESQDSLGGVYDCLKLNGAEPVNVGASGSMKMVNGGIYVSTETVLNFRFDVPVDYDTAKPDLSAD